MDRGPWKINYDRADVASGVESGDFEHDVVLRVTGDFAGPDQLKQYCEWLARKLNAVEQELPK